MVYCTQTYALTLPKNLSPKNGAELSSRFGFQSIQRINGPASSVGLMPGVFPGVELLLVVPPSEDLGEEGQLSNFMPLPRLFVAKGFPYHVDVYLHFFPPFVMPAYHSWGGSVKWAPFTEEDLMASVAVKGSFMRSGFVSSSVTTTTGTLDVVASKDFVTILPYFGLGLLYTHTSIKKEFMQNQREGIFSRFGVHAYLGVQVRLPVTFNVELGYSGDQFYAGLSIGKNFYDTWPVTAAPNG